MRLHSLLVFALLVGACGDDPPPPAKKPGAPGAKPGAKGAPGSKTAQLQPRTHVENRVKCPSPAKPTVTTPPDPDGPGAACNKDVPTCDTGLYCLPIGDKHFCEACPERDSIRHEFKDRDFVPGQIRDPFQSFTVIQKGLEAPPDEKIEGPCKRQDQFVAMNYSYLDMKLVGIVAQGTQKKVLMMDRGNLGHIIRRGDCVGKEKAVVKDIGTGYVTFVVHPDPEDKTPNRQPVERSLQLHPKGLQATPQTAPDAMAPTAPIVAPPGTPAPAAPTGPTAPGQTAPVVPPPVP